ncbi:MAG TPA: cellulase family glycosylhydrolase [Polyangiaceae bacterium]|jgi:hypothetical protein|nr:cellulase family glycosylhydrolase [Polyangiaceae bacterium]
MAGPSSGISAGPSTGTGTMAGPSSGRSGGSTGTSAGSSSGTTGTSGAVTSAKANDAGGGGAGGADGGASAGWLHTMNNHIYEADGAPWMGRGVNIDDLLFCGYNYNLQTLGATTAEADVRTVIDQAVTQWHSNFLRISLYMDSYGTVLDWASDTDGYASAMTRIVKYVGTQYPGTYVLLSLRSDASMNCPSEPACVPTASTIPVYQALLDSFANDSFVVFGLANEPAPSTAAELITAMNLGVAAIRSEETKLGVPQHLIAVQTMSSTGSFTTTSIQPSGNILYEVHYYPTLGSGGPSYYSSYAPTFPMVIGEYGDFGSSGNTSAASFFKDLEDMQIPSLAWDFDPLNDCAPDLLNTNSGNAVSPVTASSWGQVVQPYLANPGSFK